MMPKTYVRLTRGGFPGLYIGIDPGVEGAAVALGENGTAVLRLSKTTPRDVWDWLRPTVGDRAERFAVIERIVPRPTFMPTLGKSSILKSTCELYGSYMMLRGLLIASGIPHTEVDPKKWQAIFGIPPRKKDEREGAFKNRLKARAQSLFPREKIILDTADAFLIAEYCRRTRKDLL